MAKKSKERRPPTVTDKPEPPSRKKPTAPPATPGRKPRPPAPPTRHAARAPVSQTTKQPKHLDENTVRAIRCAYRPGVRLRRLEEQFGLSSGSIISVANRCTYVQYPTGDGEYEPPASIRGTRRREQAPVATSPNDKPAPVEQTSTEHLMPEALAVIREAVENGEPLRRISRCFGLTPEAIAHMKPRRGGEPQ